MWDQISVVLWKKVGIEIALKKKKGAVKCLQVQDSSFQTWDPHPEQEKFKKSCCFKLHLFVWHPVTTTLHPSCKRCTVFPLHRTSSTKSYACVFMLLIVLCSAILQSRALTVACDFKWVIASLYSTFDYPTKWCTYSTVWVTWLAPRETAAVSAHSAYNHAPCHVTSYKATYVGCRGICV